MTVVAPERIVPEPQPETLPRYGEKYDAEVLERVKLGLKLLEDKHGPGWEDKIDMEALDLRHGSRCVIGQVFEDGPTTIGMMWTDLVGYGFASLKESTDERLNEYERLQAAWEDVLTPRVTRGRFIALPDHP